jgi:chitinase
VILNACAHFSETQRDCDRDAKRYRSNLDDALNPLSNYNVLTVSLDNTYECSAKKGYEEMTTGGNDFTFNQWAEWLKANSNNPSVKLYMGLPAGEAGLPTHKDHYLNPKQAYSLISKWKAAYPTIFGGVMLWVRI